MKRYEIMHETVYRFSGPVRLLPHTFRLRPREGHELRIETASLELAPPATLRWQRDAEGNSVVNAVFDGTTTSLLVTSNVIIQKYDQSPFDFLVADHAVDFPFNYQGEDRVLLLPYTEQALDKASAALVGWVKGIWQPGERIQSFALLLRLNQHIHGRFAYRMREEEGVQSPEQTLSWGSGSCRDFAALFMAAARHLGFAARFVSGYIKSDPYDVLAGATHAWAEVFLPGAGWKGFDPTTGIIAGTDHIAVAVARLPQSVPPVAGSFLGPPGASMTVNVRVTEITP